MKIRLPRRSGVGKASGLTLVLALACASTSIAAAELLGAEKVISILGQTGGSTAGSPVAASKDEAKRLALEIGQFKSAGSTLPPQEAADRWLQLYDRFRMLPPEALTPEQRIFAARNSDRLSLATIVGALPPPPAWQALKTRVLARPAKHGDAREAVVRVLMHLLTEDFPALEKGLADLKADATLNGDRATATLLRGLSLNRRQGIAQGREAIADAFDAYLQSLKVKRPEGRIAINVPDLVALVGEKRTAESIGTAISVPGLILSVPAGGATLEVAKRVALANSHKLIDAQWNLITDVDDIELYEAMERRFPDSAKKEKSAPDIFRDAERNVYRENTDNDARRRARIAYLLGLVARNRIHDAIEHARRMDAQDFEKRDFRKRWQSFDKLKHAEGLHRFCKTLLDGRPEVPLWKQCGIVSAGLGKADELLAIVQAALRKPGLGIEARLAMRERQVDLLLATDRVDDALATLNTALGTDDRGETPQARIAATKLKVRLAQRLCALGRLLERTDLIRRSEAILIAALKHDGSRAEGFENSFADVQGSDSPMTTLIDALIEIGDFARAEDVVTAAMRTTLAARELNGPPQVRDASLANGILSGHLVRLAEIYDRAGRPADVLLLLEKSAWWGAEDLIDIADRHPILSSIAARALRAAGRNDEALAVLDSHLRGNPADDSAYAILTEILGPASLPRLDALYAGDRFEERPLIWKAHLLHKAGKLDEAEVVARQALKIDPTDGEQKAGDRGRGYVVLAGILRAKGKADDAAFFDGVVKAVRIAEKGDKLTDAGLIQRSLASYEEASWIFADAYCIQWRLAERLSALGNLAAAKKHYEIAFERMPEQFGRVAHFCFGCEGVFTHQQSVSVAETVLTTLAVNTPRKPQVQYLLGQLRQAQGRKADSYRHFRAAAEIDPEYLDAWKESYALRDDVFLDQGESDDIALRMLGLDPRGRHVRVDRGEIFALKALWSLYETSARNRVALPKALLPLAASKQAIETISRQVGERFVPSEWEKVRYRQSRTTPDPADAVVGNTLVKRLLTIADRSGGYEDIGDD